MNESSKGNTFSLSVIDIVADIQIIIYIKVENRQNLSIVWDERLAYHFVTDDHLLNGFQCKRNNLLVPRIKVSFLGDEKNKGVSKRFSKMKKEFFK